MYHTLCPIVKSTTTNSGPSAIFASCGNCRRPRIQRPFRYRPHFSIATSRGDIPVDGGVISKPDISSPFGIRRQGLVPPPTLYLAKTVTIITFSKPAPGACSHIVARFSQTTSYCLDAADVLVLFGIILKSSVEPQLMWFFAA